VSIHYLNHNASKIRDSEPEYLFYCRFAARCYQRVLPAACCISEGTSSDAAESNALVAGGVHDEKSLDTAEGIVSRPSFDTRLAANESGGGKLNNRSSGGEAAEGGDPNLNGTLAEFLSVLGQSDMKAKYEVVRKLSSRSELAGVFSESFEESFDDPSLLGRKERPHEDTEDCVHDEHTKRGRFKEETKAASNVDEIADSLINLNVASSADGTVAVPPQNFLNKCIMVVIRHLSTQLDEDTTHQLTDALDKIQLAQEEDFDKYDTVSEYSTDLYGDVQSVSSEDIYGESMSCASDDEALFRLYDCLDEHPGQIRMGVQGSVVVDARWWKKLAIRLKAFETKEDGVNVATMSNLEEKGNQVLNDLNDMQGKAGKVFHPPPLALKKEDAKVVAGIAVGAAAVAGLAAAAYVASSSGDNHVKASSIPKAQKIHNLPDSSPPAKVPLVKVKGEPFQPFMTREQNQRARMVALFKAVDPGKLANLDELVEKRARANGFDRMWVSYKEKWGAAAVEKAFAKVREKKKEFYRAKIVALFAANQPGKLQEVDHLMAKHDGQYDQMFKRWVENRKFDVDAVMEAHIKATKKVGTCKALLK